MVISSLGGGGAERVISLLANEWSRRGHNVTLITLAATGRDSYQLDLRVKRIGLDVVRSSANYFMALWNNLRRIAALRNSLKDARPDTIVSFLTSTNVLCALAARKMRVPVFLAERISLDDHFLPRAWKELRRIAYRNASAVVVQTKRNKEWFDREMPGLTVRVIPNPVALDVGQAPDEVSAAAIRACEYHQVLLGCGRLDYQKGFDLLLAAFAQISQKYPNWRLVVMGEGAERRALLEQAERLSISDRVYFPGFTSSPHALMSRAQSFVLSSRYEGFPNALLEAMACGLPCVSFDCRTGPAELIAHDQNGLLVPAGDVIELAKHLDRLLDDNELRTRLGGAGQRSAAGYSIGSIADMWDNVIRRQIAAPIAETGSALHP